MVRRLVGLACLVGPAGAARIQSTLDTEQTSAHDAAWPTMPSMEMPAGYSVPETPSWPSFAPSPPVNGPSNEPIGRPSYEPIGRPTAPAPPPAHQAAPAPPASNLARCPAGPRGPPPRITTFGHECKKVWTKEESPTGVGGCSDYCCNPDNDPNGEWCMIKGGGFGTCLPEGSPKPPPPMRPLCNGGESWWAKMASGCIDEPEFSAQVPAGEAPPPPPCTMGCHQNSFWNGAKTENFVCGMNHARVQSQWSQTDTVLGCMEMCLPVANSPHPGQTTEPPKDRYGHSLGPYSLFSLQSGKCYCGHDSTIGAHCYPLGEPAQRVSQRFDEVVDGKRYAYQQCYGDLYGGGRDQQGYSTSQPAVMEIYQIPAPGSY